MAPVVMPSCARIAAIERSIRIVYRECCGETATGTARAYAATRPHVSWRRPEGFVRRRATHPLARDDGMRGRLGTRTPISRDTYSACNFHLPSTICTITRARE